MDIPFEMTERKITIKKGIVTIIDKAELVYEKEVTRFGNSAKVNVPKKHIGKRAYIIILRN